MRNLVLSTVTAMALMAATNASARAEWTVTCTGIDNDHTVWSWQGQTNSYSVAVDMARHCTSQGGSFLQSSFDPYN